MEARRTFLKGLLAGGGTLVIGWSPLRRSWVTRADASEPFDELPPLDGTLSTDASTRQEFGEDFGHIRHRFPVAVLTPGSVDDVVTMVRFARRHRLGVAMNGQAGTNDRRESHSQYGQAQAEGGVVVDAKPLSTIYGIDPDERVADIGAGARWSDLYDAAEAFGLAPAVMTDFMHLSIGGTLSVGGIGGHMPRLGTQADNVVELEVVTGAGDRVTCSDTRHQQLFRAVLAGCGQTALIVRAKVRLEPSFSHALLFNLFYDDAATYVADQKMLLDDGRFDYQEGQIPRRPDDTGWRYMIEAVKYFNAPDDPDPAPLLAGLHDDRSSLQTVTSTYREWQFRLDPVVSILKAIGFWETAHPWVNVWLPESRAASFVSELFAGLTTADLGVGLALFYPVDTRKVGVPLFRLPRERVAFQLGFLRFPPPVPGLADALLEQNRRIYDAAVAAGGTRYVIGAIPRFTRQDWRRHFQPKLGFLTRSKHIYDPDNVLTPGFGIF